MTHIFDEAMRRVRMAAEDASRYGVDANEVFLDKLGAIELPFIQAASELAADRETPKTVRAKLMDLVETQTVAPLDGDDHKVSKQYAVTLRSSPFLTALHSLMHDIAGQHIQTRYGELTDDLLENALCLETNQQLARGPKSG